LRTLCNQFANAKPTTAPASRKRSKPGPTMKFALVDGQRREAQPGLSGECPGCKGPVVAKCGEVRVWHWAHRGRRFCDSWWEHETEWHRAWKTEFPVEWQEKWHWAEDGEPHIADVKTDAGWVIEFQHSNIKPEERRAREAFYSKLIWVIDGKRLKRDEEQFANAFDQGLAVGPVGAWRKIISDRCGLLRRWARSNSPIFLDFGGDVLWWLSAASAGSAYVVPIPRAQFIEAHRTGATEAVREFEKLLNEGIPEMIALHEKLLRGQSLRRGWDPLQLPRPRRRFRR
jgi:hypothetical protein